MTNPILKEQNPSLLKRIATHPATLLILGTMIGAFLQKQGVFKKLAGKLFSQKSDSEE